MTKGQTTTAKGIRLRDDTWEWLDTEAGRRRLTVNEIINEYLKYIVTQINKRRLQQ